MSGDKKYVLLNTVYRGDNFGSSLQAYALKKYVEEKFKVDCIIVERNEVGFMKKLCRLETVSVNFFKSFLSPRLFRDTWTSHFRKRCPQNRYSDAIQYNFMVFIEAELSPTYLSGKKMKELARSRSCLRCITGSDQVWNPTGTHLKKDNFLTFSPKSKNISYSASIGADKIPYYNYLPFRRYVSKINYISVREETAGQLLMNNFHISARVCVDPVLLAGKDFWIEKLKSINMDTPFIIGYFLNKPSENAITEIRRNIANNRSVYVVSKCDFPQYVAGTKQVSDLSPFEFISYICHSECVLTDSFHGMLFSILFNKKFFVYERDYEKSVPQHSRIVSLLNGLNIADRYIRNDVASDTAVLDDIDYSMVNPIIEQMRKQSVSFLCEALRDE
ncbi:MAG: polysaccharide pyruvyl transferase family protein [Hespellia sp.]|nr:polysaccharide pyruvyl transferase family protein [Hespellia sp.]